MADAAPVKRVLVTGANKGIGLAVVAALLAERADVHVVLGARDAARGAAARATLRAADAARCTVLQLDVTSPASVAAAAAALGTQPPLYGLVNNAGLWGAPAETLATNLRGVQRVTDALLLAALLQPGARVVNVSSGMAPAFVAKCTAARQRALTTAAASTAEVARMADEFLAAHEGASADGGAALGALGYPPADADGQAAYGASKALLNLHTLTLARQLGPRAVVTACSPGFIDTDMTQRFFSAARPPAAAGALPPAAATRVVLHLLFGAAAGSSGHYFGSDARRSPLDRYRSPGEPEYAPEPAAGGGPAE